MTENERIRNVRQNYGLTLEAFGKRVGVTKAAMSNIENGSRGVTDQMRRSICREFNVNEAWLRTGDGDMNSYTLSQVAAEIAGKYGLEHRSEVFLERFIMLPDDARSVLLDFVQDVASALSGAADHQNTIANKVASYKNELVLQEEAAERSSALRTQDDDTDKMA